MHRTRCSILGQEATAVGFPCVNTPNVESGTFVRPAIVAKGARSFIELKVRHAHPELIARLLERGVKAGVFRAGCAFGVGSRKVEFEFELDFRGAKRTWRQLSLASS